MAAKDQSSAPAGSKPKHVLDREDFSDFTIVVENGHEIKCHKLMLAKASPVFCAMMKDNFVETLANKMEMTEFDQKTLESFLDYIYEVHDLIPDKDVYMGSFDKKRITIELLRFSHMYDVQNLLEMCIEHFKKNVDDANAVEVWTTAEAIGHEELKEAALGYLLKKEDNMLMVPQVEESYQHSPQLMKSLVKYLLRHPYSGPSVTIKVQCYPEAGGVVVTRTICVKQSDTVKVLKALTEESLPEAGYHRWRCRKGSFRHMWNNSASRFEENQTLGFYNVENRSNYTATFTFTKVKRIKK